MVWLLHHSELEHEQTKTGSREELQEETALFNVGEVPLVSLCFVQESQESNSPTHIRELHTDRFSFQTVAYVCDPCAHTYSVSFLLCFLYASILCTVLTCFFLTIFIIFVLNFYS